MKETKYEKEIYVCIKCDHEFTVEKDFTAKIRCSKCGGKAEVKKFEKSNN